MLCVLFFDCYVLISVWPMNPHPDLTSSVIHGLGWYYLVLFFMNLYWTVRSFKVDGEFGKDVPLVGGLPVASLWASFSAVLVMVSVAHFSRTGSPETFMIRLPEFFKSPVDAFFADPVVYFLGSVSLFVAMIVFHEHQ